MFEFDHDSLEVLKVVVYVERAAFWNEAVPVTGSL